MTESTPEQNDHSPRATQATPVVVVRMSAIGDTIMTAQAQAELWTRGFAPTLLTHHNNKALLECMPNLQGACLWADGNFEFFLRSSATAPLSPVTQSDFVQWLLNHTGGTADSKCHILDFQRTNRSQRAIRDLRKTLSTAGVATAVRTVAKNTLWRLVLILWAHFAFKQWHGRTPPLWLRKRLKSVHQHQLHVIQSLPPQPSSREADGAHPPRLCAPTFNHDQLGNNYVVLAVGASARLKGWPRESYRELIRMIVDGTDLNIGLCGGAGDAAVGEFLVFQQSARVVNLIGRTNLSQTLAVIRGAQYVVTGDSFASHVCDLMGVPASVVFGATHPQLGFAPQGPVAFVHHSELSCSPCSRHGQGQCRFKNMRCLTSIKPEQVFAQLRTQLFTTRQ